MTSAAILAALIAAGGAQPADEPAPPPALDDALSAHSVNRGVEEPGRYGAANLFDGNVRTAYCSAPGGLAQVTVGLSHADEARLAPLTGVRITPGAAFPASRLEGYFYLRTTTGFGGGRIAGPIGPAPTTLTLAKDGHQGGSEIMFILRSGGDPRHPRGPLCLAEIVFLSATGTIDLPDLSRAVEADRARDAALARLTADRTAFARAYLTAFSWSLLNPHKEETDWESAGYRFLVDGTFEKEIIHILRPERTKGRWAVGKDGKQVLLNGVPVRLAPCGGRGGYLCLAGDQIFPDPAW
jgi:hypothetical protein